MRIGVYNRRSARKKHQDKANLNLPYLGRALLLSWCGQSCLIIQESIHQPINQINQGVDHPNILQTFDLTLLSVFITIKYTCLEECGKDE